MATVALFTAFYYMVTFIIGRHRGHLLFTLVCVTIAYYEITCVLLYNAATVYSGVFWQRQQFIALSLLMPLIVWFITDALKRYTPLRWVCLLTISGLGVIGAVFMAVLPNHALTLTASHPHIKTMAIAGRYLTTYYEATLGLVPQFISFLGLLTTVYIVVLLAIRVRRPPRVFPGMLLAGGVLILAGAINDVLFSLGLVSTLYLMEYTFLAWIIAMTMTFILRRFEIERQLRQNRRLFSTVLEKLPLPGAVWQTPGPALMLNEEFRRVFGPPPETMSYDDWLATVAGGEPDRDGGQLLRGADGQERPYEIYSAVVGDLKPVLLNDVSVTYAHRVEREKWISKLEAINHELNDFTYTVSHDLRSPLLTIRGFIDIVKMEIAEGGSTDNIYGYLDRISDGADNLHERLEGLLRLSRSGRATEPFRRFSMRQLCEKINEQLESQLRQRGIRLIIDPHLRDAHGDPGRVHDVVQNLVENALKFSPHGKGRVEISQRLDNGHPEYTVSDNGIGIDPARREEVFHVFNKIDKKSHGTGIGLTIVKKIIDAHGGRIRLESGEEGGTTVCFTLATPNRSL